MNELKVILNKLEGMEQRIQNLENNKKVEQPQKPTFHATHPDEVPVGHMMFAGRYQSLDGSMSSTFGASDIKISDLLNCNSFEMAKVIDAFSSEDRINIVKELIQRSMNAKELMEKLKFQTTGKLYHHLSFLEKIGVIRKDSDQYHVSARYISCVILIALGVERIISKNSTPEA